MSTYYTCNGSPKGCERERFGQCVWHEAQEAAAQDKWQVTSYYFGGLQTCVTDGATVFAMPDIENARRLAVFLNQQDAKTRELTASREMMRTEYRRAETRLEKARSDIELHLTVVADLNRSNIAAKEVAETALRQWAKCSAMYDAEEAATYLRCVNAIKEKQK